jgi:hypothetical protein
MSDERPKLTPEAEKLFKEHQLKLKGVMWNVAEKRALDEGRNEINETDIREAQRSVPITKSKMSRKWAIRILIFLTFAFLVVQIGAFYQFFQSSEIATLPLVTQVWLVVPPVLVFCTMICFTWIFKEDWI